MCSPPPCGEGLGVGVTKPARSARLHPTPNPSSWRSQAPLGRQGEGNPVEQASLSAIYRLRVLEPEASTRKLRSPSMLPGSQASCAKKAALNRARCCARHRSSLGISRASRQPSRGRVCRVLARVGRFCDRLGTNRRVANRRVRVHACCPMDGDVGFTLSRTAIVDSLTSSAHVPGLA